MFGIFKRKKKGIIDKVIIGAIIGGAIGSVIGASIAPKKGEETRKDVKILAKGFFQNIKKLILKKQKKEEVKQIPHEHA